MPFKVDLSVTSAADAIPSPTGLAAGTTRFSITDTAGNIVQSQDVNGSSASFSGIPDGTFTASAQLLDTAGANLGDAVTTSFVDGNPVTPPDQGGGTPTDATFVPLASISATVTAE
jgi:hypothetical protein